MNLSCALKILFNLVNGLSPVSISMSYADFALCNGHSSLLRRRYLSRHTMLLTH